MPPTSLCYMPQSPFPKLKTPFLGLRVGLYQGSPRGFLPQSAPQPSRNLFQLHVAATGPWKCQLLLSCPGLGPEARPTGGLGLVLGGTDPVPLALPLLILRSVLFPTALPAPYQH